MTLKTFQPVWLELMNHRQENINLNATAWKMYSKFYTKGVVQDIAAKKTLLTAIANAHGDILDDITARISSINGVA